MIKKIILASFLIPSLSFAASVEERCFENLLQQAKNTPHFSDLDLTQVQKINGGFKSDPFSVAYYSQSHLNSAMQSELEALENEAQAAENRAESSAGLASDRAREAEAAERAFEQASAEAEEAKENLNELLQNENADPAEIKIAQDKYEAAAANAASAQTEKEGKMQEAENAQEVASDDALEAEKARKAVDDFSQSLEGERQFQEISKMALPSGLSDIRYFPDRMNQVSGELIPAIPKYKANRSNIGTVMFQNSIETNLGDVDGDGDNDFIKGYFIDSQAVTFGRQLGGLSFPYQARDPESARPWPFGKPYSDLREYLIYTHHLAPAFGGQFLSCGLIKVEPDGSNQLSDLSTGKYGGNAFEGSSYETTILPKSPESYQFRRGLVTVQALERSNAEQGAAADRYGKFRVLTLAFDNGSNFLNEFQTLQLQTQAMTNPPDQSQGMHEIIQRFYALIEDETNLQIVGGLTDYQDEAALSFNPNQLLASTFEQNSEPNPMVGGIAIGEGLPFALMKEIENVPDPAIRDYLKMTVTSGYNEIYSKKPESERSEFENKFLNCDLSLDQKIENIDFLMRNQGAENLKINNLEFKNLRFGDCAIPFADSRKLKIIENNPFSLRDLLTKYDQKRLALTQEIESLKSSGVFTGTEARRINQVSEKIEADFQAEKSNYLAAQKLYSDCQVDFLRHEIGDISKGENLDSIRQKCEEAFAALAQSIPEFGEKAEKFNGLDRSVFPKTEMSAVENSPLIDEIDSEEILVDLPPESPSEYWAQSRLIYFGLAVLTFLFAAGIFSLIFLFKRSKK